MPLCSYLSLLVWVSSINVAHSPALRWLSWAINSLLVWPFVYTFIGNLQDIVIDDDHTVQPSNVSPKKQINWITKDRFCMFVSITHID